MPNLWQSVYSDLAVPLLRLGLTVAKRRNAKLRETLAGHEGLWQRLQVQLGQRDPQRPLIWFHVASAGEYLQAMPVAERCMAAGWQCALTVTSVSGYRWAIKRREAHPDLIAVDYLPLDSRSNMRRLLGLIKPTVLVHVKFDLWPNLIWEARARGVPQFLISATLHERSKRVTSAPARAFYRRVYGALDGIFAVSADDRARFLRTCPDHPKVEVLGDTRFDSVLDRKQALTPPELPDYVRRSGVIVLGSTWPPDEERVLPPVREALARHDDLLCMAVPHETDEGHLQAIEKAFSAFPTVRFSRVRQGTARARVILVDTVGVLSALYAYADIAYVGGAFGRGVHNVMEPAAMGVPTLFGPFYQNSPEAMDLLAEDKCFSIADGNQFRQRLDQLLTDPEQSRRIGAEAANYIESRAGAADLCFQKIRDYVQ